MAKNRFDETIVEKYENKTAMKGTHRQGCYFAVEKSVFKRDSFDSFFENMSRMMCVINIPRKPREKEWYRDGKENSASLKFGDLLYSLTWYLSSQLRRDLVNFDHFL